MTKPSTHETKEPGALFPRSQKKDLCAIRGDATKLHLDGRAENYPTAVDIRTILQYMQDINFSRLFHQLHQDYK